MVANSAASLTSAKVKGFRALVSITDADAKIDAMVGGSQIFRVSGFFSRVLGGGSQIFKVSGFFSRVLGGGLQGVRKFLGFQVSSREFWVRELLLLL